MSLTLARTAVTRKRDDTRLLSVHKHQVRARLPLWSVLALAVALLGPLAVRLGARVLPALRVSVQHARVVHSPVGWGAPGVPALRAVGDVEKRVALNDEDVTRGLVAYHRAVRQRGRAWALLARWRECRSFMISPPQLW